MNDEQNNVADAATESAIEAHLTGNAEKAAPLFDRASVERQRAVAAAENGTDRSWRDGNDVQPLAPMPAAPPVTSKTDAAVTKLSDMGGAHQELVASWGSDAPVNMEYAASAFREAVTADPGLIAAFDRAGLGNSATIIAHLSRHGRMQAGMMGTLRASEPAPMPTFTPSASRASPPTVRSGSTGNNGSAETQSTLNQMLRDFPPGSQGYKDNAQRIQQLYKTLAGSGAPVGIGGRTA